VKIGAKLAYDNGKVFGAFQEQVRCKKFVKRVDHITFKLVTWPQKFQARVVYYCSVCSAGSCRQEGPWCSQELHQVVRF